MEFAFQRLDVWQKAVEFAIAMNIAEGKGRYSKKEFVHFLYIARGSLYETITLLTIMQRRGWIVDDVLDAISGQADVVARKIAGLINSLKTDVEAVRT